MHLLPLILLPLLLLPAQLVFGPALLRLLPASLSLELV